MLHLPVGGRALNEYRPSASVITERVNPVSRFFTVTVAPGSTAPVVSVTTPARSNLVTSAWAGDKANVDASSVTTANQDSLTRMGNLKCARRAE